ncbi:cell division protein FtsA [Fructilactobacillus fructivorans]|uniref:Cell division protein FtsA n=1 Tax=Fructilactobacillus fructivorans TaxID=1614 RepID=A0AAE6P0V5_9LACO|nr:cell division protein FtsA [Fructilactobacillus fructivorans]QFX92815.1 cell division protein FtsA [Fructilactobacillus fructivorans]RDV65593.1 cell division protein FtsA [Fructilactobacillus fructivorans]
MNDSNMYIGLDIGTTSIKVIVAEKANNQMNVIGVGNERSTGVSRGVIVDIDKASNAIGRAIRQAEEKASVKISNVIVGIPADQIKIDKCSGMIELPDQSEEITNDDVVDVAESAIDTNLPPEREVIDLTPDEFMVDGFDGIQDPRGMVGNRLKMNGRMISGPKTIIHNIKKAVTNAGLNIEALVVDPQAEGKYILSESEQEFGTILIDLGGGQSTVAVIHDFELKYANVDLEGGQYITKDISSVLNTSASNAEKLKRGYGYADVDQASEDNEFPVDVVGQGQPVNVSEKLLAEIIEARIDQIFSRLKTDLDGIDALSLPGGIVLTGGVASMPGIAELAANTFGVNVRVYIPDQIGLRHPSLSLALSLVNYGGNLSQIERLVRSAFDHGEFTHSDNGNAREVEPESEPKVSGSIPFKQKRQNKTAKKKREKKPKSDKNLGERFSGIVHHFFE